MALVRIKKELGTNSEELKKKLVDLKKQLIKLNSEPNISQSPGRSTKEKLKIRRTIAIIKHKLSLKNNEVKKKI